MSVLAVLLVVIIVIIIVIIVWLKRRAKKLKPADNNASTTSPQTSPPAVMTDTEKAYNMALLHDNPSYQPTTAVLSEASNVTQLQENPSYQPITMVPVSDGTDASNMKKIPHILYQPIFQPAQTDGT